MRRRLSIAIAALAVVIAGAALAVRGGEDGTKPIGGIGYETRTVAAGEIDVKIEPRQVDDRGAIFHITLDTHSVELDADLTRATLVVGTTEWPVEGWTGDGPGGHHREGELRFRPAGAVGGTLSLTIPGFAVPVRATWELTD